MPWVFPKGKDEQFGGDFVSMRLVVLVWLSACLSLGCESGSTGQLGASKKKEEEGKKEVKAGAGEIETDDDESASNDEGSGKSTGYQHGSNDRHRRTNAPHI